MPVSDLLSLSLAVLFPIVAILATRRRWVPEWSSSIILCYGAGILIANLRGWEINGPLLEAIAGGSMLVGLPLLLFSVRVRDLLRFGKPMLFSFLLCCLAGVCATGLTALYAQAQVEDVWQIAGMLTGLYTGGTPNVQAIGLALEAPAEYVVLIQAADVLLGGAYLLGLLTILPALYGKIFSPSPVTPDQEPVQNLSDPPATWSRWVKQLLAGLSVTAAGFLTTRAVTGAWFDPTALILFITTLSIVLALSGATRRIGNSYALGEYFVLIFCVALGLLADFRQLAEDGLDLLYFSAIALTLTILVHLLLAKLFRVDRDTVILSSVAALYGPVFVVQVATAIRNTRLLPAGIAVSLVGFGIGNYLGIGLAYALRWMVG
ncbi:putative membrane protein [Neolewinella xylanilytica]|uniref:Putative membrane protein n=1 Tax=Neolewinella xylanilytica TaxID=1514080 RepID=A0A2S6I5A3_9BACT|nr:DUF819 family protein [Neolewinella xylanilytica]PPK86348.1 putative membrane protein [Neolewinella xylanilytica]